MPRINKWKTKTIISTLGKHPCCFLAVIARHINLIKRQWHMWQNHRCSNLKIKSSHLYPLSPPLMHLHWLAVSARIHFKIALLTFKSLHTIAPSYLSSLIHPYVPLRTLRSSSAYRLCVPHVSTVFGPTFWNSLPFSVTSCSTIHTFKKHLRHTCLPQPSPLVELTSMRLWFDDLHLFAYLVVLDFVRA